MQEALDLSWAEFVLRSIAFRENREFEVLMTREVAYQGYRAQYVFSKKKPLSKDNFWPIGKTSKTASEKQRDAFMEAFKKYKKQKDG